MEILEKLLVKYNFKKRTSKPKTTFEEVEAVIKFKLPEDYKFYAINYMGFEDSIGEDYLRLLDFDELIEENNNCEISYYLDKTLIVGSNAGGEFIGIEKTNVDNLRIIISPYIFEKEAHIEIGYSFTNLLERMDRGERWFK